MFLNTGVATKKINKLVINSLENCYVFVISVIVQYKQVTETLIMSYAKKILVSFGVLFVGVLVPFAVIQAVNSYNHEYAHLFGLKNILLAVMALASAYSIYLNQEYAHAAKADGNKFFRNCFVAMQVLGFALYFASCAFAFVVISIRGFYFL